MNNLYSKILKTLSIAVVSLVALPSAAQTVTPITDGETASANKKYVFTAPSTGTLQITANNNFVQLYDLLYSSEACTEDDVIPPYSSVYTSKGYDYYFAVNQGKDYYFYYSYTSVGGQPATFTFNMIEGEIPNEITLVSPEPTTSVTYNLASAPNIDIVFMRQGTLTGTGKLVYQRNDGSENSVPVYYEAVDKGGTLTYELGIKRAISPLKSQMKDNSDFSVVIEDPRIDGEPVTGPSKYLNADGNIELRYHYVAQTSIKYSSYPNPFLSFWPENSDKGIIYFEFDGPLAPLEKQSNMFFSIYAGPHMEDGNEATPWPQLPGAPVEIEDNKITIDLRGVQRVTDQSTVSIYLSGVIAADGQSIDYNGSGLILLYEIPYKLLQQVNLEYDLNPAAGSLYGVDKLEVWIGAETFNHVEIKSFNFKVGDGAPYSYTIADCDPAADPLDAGSMYYYVPVPEEVQTGSNVTFFVGLSSLDGYDYAIEAQYNVQDGVETIEVSSEKDVYYDLMGRRIVNPERGIYILNGKKVVLNR